jgi:hypothetical protein
LRFVYGRYRQPTSVPGISLYETTSNENNHDHHDDIKHGGHGGDPGDSDESDRYDLYDLILPKNNNMHITTAFDFICFSNKKSSF